jgi:type II secretory pathway pseudopilin PulG
MKNKMATINDNKKLNDKKGFLLGEETIKVVIAVICIAFLIFLLFSVYLSFSGSQQNKEAEASMKDIFVKEIQRINSGGAVNSNGILIPNPAGWYIFSFTGEDKKPNLCSQTNCICICQNILLNIFDRQIKSCDDKGSCYVLSSIEKFEKIKIENSGTFVSVQKINNFMDIAKK